MKFPLRIHCSDRDNNENSKRSWARSGVIHFKITQFAPKTTKVVKLSPPKHPKQVFSSILMLYIDDTACNFCNAKARRKCETEPTIWRSEATGIKMGIFIDQTCQFVY